MFLINFYLFIFNINISIIKNLKNINSMYFKTKKTFKNRLNYNFKHPKKTPKVQSEENVFKFFKKITFPGQLDN
jgi:hypothetical protein